MTTLNKATVQASITAQTVVKNVVQRLPTWLRPTVLYGASEQSVTQQRTVNINIAPQDGDVAILSYSFYFDTPIIKLIDGVEEEIVPIIRTAKGREEKIAEYEAMFGMTSEMFWQEAKAGRRPDSFEASDWMSLLRFR